MFTEALHIEAAEALAAIGAPITPGQYVFNDYGHKGRVLAASEECVSVCWNLKDFRRAYRRYYEPLVTVTFYFADCHETMTLRRSEISEAEDMLVEDFGECLMIRVKS